MGTSGAQDFIQNHGTAMDKDKNKVRCKHCGKLVPGFHHLKHHLGGVGNEVAACLHVPANIMTHMRDDLLVMDQAPGGLNGNESVPIVEEAVDDIIEEERKDCSKCVGRFFLEAGIDLSAVGLPSFQKMVDAVIKCGSGFKVPNVNELRGWVPQEDFEEVQGRVQDVKQSWERTGCSILLDVWTNQRGKSLISFLVDCPKGTVFLRSIDASNTIQDPDALALLLGSIIEEVGVDNVIQVITCEASAYMMVAGKILTEKYNIFWTVCADYCVNLILERIEAMDHVQLIMAKAKFITSFIYSHGLPRDLMRKHITGGELVKTSMLKSIASFITLENIVSEKENLMSMFTSLTWSRSTCSSKIKGEMICELINDSSFWDAAVDILKITSPLTGVLHLTNGGDTAPMGFLYEVMDRAKEEIEKNLGGEEEKYLLFWLIIDEIWDSYLHSPLHSTAFYLNPSFFYSNDFYVDAEVVNGLLSCTVRMTENREQQEMIALQLNSYRDALEGFKEEMAINQRSTVHPAIWWSTHGGHCPELQVLAVKILSQTCTTSSRYKLRRRASEQLHSEGPNYVERKKLSEMEFVQNNRRLWQSQSDNILLEGLAPLVDWTVEGI